METREEIHRSRKENKMIDSKEEALYHISHTEQLFAWGEISKTALKEKLEYFLGVL